MVSGKGKPSIPEFTKLTDHFRFGAFELNLHAGELRKHGLRLKLHEQPFQVLVMLLTNPGELVTREEIQKKLWPSGTFVDFENGLNSAVTRLRDALADSADEPRFIETVPRRGYRFIAPVERLNGDAAAIAEAKPEPSLRRAKQWRWLAGAGVTVVLIVVAFAGWRLSTSPRKILHFGARDWVLISNFENRTGNPVLDGTLEYALERELSNSQFVNVVPHERVDDVLRLMRKPLDTKIDAALGREICLRDGGIRVLLTGRIEKLGTTYVLTTNLVDPAGTITFRSMSEEDPADAKLAAAIRRLSNRVREALGEERQVIQQSEQHLEKVTTPSLRALQLYTQADRAIRLDSLEIGAELLERVLQEDPDFASAHLLLAYAYSGLGDKGRSVPHFQRAFELADSVTDRERFFIRGTYYDVMAKDPQKAVEAYETLLQLYPDHFWGTNRLMHLDVALGRTDDVSKLWIRAADLSPWDLGSNGTAVWAKAISQQDWKGAQPYIQRAKALIALQGESSDPFVATWIKLLPVYESWLKGDVERAHAELIQIEQKSQDLDAEEVGLSHLDFGELRRAERSFQDPRWSADAEGFLLFIRGDWPALKKHLPKMLTFAAPRSPALIFMARAGMWSDVAKSIREAGPGRRSKIAEGELALAQGQTDKGIPLIEDGLSSHLSWPAIEFFLGSESLARAYQEEGKLDEALRVLEQASAEKGRTYPNPETGAGSFGSVWMRTELQLADLYRKMGRVPEAEKIEEELSKLLIFADSDHPILRELQKRGRLVALAVD